MEPHKYCARCGAWIADEISSDWYSYIRIKYCPTCRKAVRQEDTRQRIRQLRKDARANRKRKDELIERLKAENAALRARVHGGESCVACGETIPEGRQVCPTCERR